MPRGTLASDRIMTLGIFSWCLYDWANAAFGTLITTFIFAPYFIKSVAASPTEGTILWGFASSAAAFVVAVLSPVLGAIADKAGQRKPWLIAFTSLCVVFSASLYLVRPAMADVSLALVLFASAAVSADLAFVFYNAMLPRLVPRAYLGRVSGWGWSLGYVGGIASLAAALFGFVLSGAPFAQLDQGAAENVRATALLVAGWYAVFTLPLALFTPDSPPRGIPLANAVRQGLATLWDTLHNARDYRNILHFLLAFLFYANGFTTLFAFGGIYAAGVFDMTLQEVITFAIGLNLTAGLGAAGFGWIDDRIGSKHAITLSLLGMLVAGTILVLTTSILVVWIIGLLLGLFLGGGQATSRSMMAKLAPAQMETEMFGLYAFAGRATAFAGPLAVALTTDLFDSQRAGMAAILMFFVIGLIILSRVKNA